MTHTFKQGKQYTVFTETKSGNITRRAFTARVLDVDGQWVTVLTSDGYQEVGQLIERGTQKEVHFRKNGGKTIYFIDTVEDYWEEKEAIEEAPQNASETKEEETTQEASIEQAVARESASESKFEVGKQYLIEDMETGLVGAIGTVEEKWGESLKFIKVNGKSHPYVEINRVEVAFIGECKVMKANRRFSL